VTAVTVSQRIIASCDGRKSCTALRTTRRDPRYGRHRIDSPVLSSASARRAGGDLDRRTV